MCCSCTLFLQRSSCVMSSLRRAACVSVCSIASRFRQMHPTSGLGTNGVDGNVAGTWHQCAHRQTPTHTHTHTHMRTHSSMLEHDQAPLCNVGCVPQFADNASPIHGQTMQLACAGCTAGRCHTEYNIGGCNGNLSPRPARSRRLPSGTLWAPHQPPCVCCGWHIASKILRSHSGVPDFQCWGLLTWAAYIACTLNVHPV